MTMFLLCLFVNCVLIQIPYVLCQTVLTQTNSVTAQPGETARMSCDIGQGKDSKVLGFYKQAVGGVPQLVLYHYHSWGSPRYGPNFSSDRFSANKNSAGTVYELIISRTQPSDGAVYYCGKWVNAESRFVTQNPPHPKKSPVPAEELDKGKATLVCLANKLSVGLADVIWTANGSPVSGGILTSPASPQADGTFSLSSLLEQRSPVLLHGLSADSNQTNTTAAAAVRGQHFSLAPDLM
ncbi:immunoglobulin lambda-1 light chain-like [Lepisosteus oculatus]|uniref:immunoglobulin lambda-1 light chain-like n=1 Tax=Lepisosteus oculatus TaxID=7918 RepID=UPI003715124F